MKKTIILIFYFSLFTFASLHSQWFQLPNLPVSGTVWDMYFINQSTGWMSLYSPTSIIKTTDGGLNWTVQANINIRELQFLDSLTAYATGFVGTNGVLWKTTNGGTNWNSTFTINTFTDLFFANHDTGWFSGGDGFLGGVWQTTDGGVSFQRQLTSSTGTLTRIFFLKEKINGEYVGWAVIMPMVYKTTNSGVNWSLIYNGPGTFCDGTSTSDLYFRDSLNGIVTRGGGCFNITTNGGHNWTLINEFNATGGKIAMGNTQIGWISLSTDSVIKTTNFFITYGKQPIPVVAVKPIFAIDTSIVYAGLNQTVMIKTTNGGGPILSVNLISGEVPKDFKLYQNYPNPFNPTTKIKYQIASSAIGGVKRETSNVKLIVYDVMGREMEVLVDEQQRSGIYLVEWRPENLSSGVYFYTLETENFRDTKKLIYIK